MFHPLLFGNNGKPYAVPAHVYIYTFSQYRETGWAKEIIIIKKNGKVVNAACKGNLSVCLFDHTCPRVVNPG
jgi:hypothetical protein